jgi:hypothetical protein
VKNAILSAISGRLDQVADDFAALILAEPGEVVVESGLSAERR